MQIKKKEIRLERSKQTSLFLVQANLSKINHERLFEKMSNFLNMVSKN